MLIGGEQAMDDRELMMLRYSTVIELWIHHNSIQLQWPAVVISAALVVISIIVPGHLASVTSINAWGQDPSLALSAGLPLLLTGSAILVMSYVMDRGQKIMVALESEIDAVGNQLFETRSSFKDMNHPEGISGSRMAKLYITVCLALPTVFFGLSFILGMIPGTIVFSLCLMVWLMMNRFLKKFQRRTELRDTTL